MSITETMVANFASALWSNNPDRRQVVLSIFADSICEANRYGRHNWAVTFAGDRLRLHVGHYIIFTIWKPESIWICLDAHLARNLPPHAPTFEQACPNWVQDNGQLGVDYPAYKNRWREQFSLNGSFRLTDSFMQSWPNVSQNREWLHVRHLHYALIHNITFVGQRLRTLTHNTHSPAVLAFLRNELGRHVPDPLYDD